MKFNSTSIMAIAVAFAVSLSVAYSMSSPSQCATMCKQAGMGNPPRCDRGCVATPCLIEARRNPRELLPGYSCEPIATSRMAQTATSRLSTDTRKGAALPPRTSHHSGEGKK